MRKYKLLIVALILGTVCMLCGCVPGVSIDIECNGLEEGERVFVLLKPTDEDNLRVPEDADITGSEIYTADKDGFVLADQMYDPNVRFGTESLKGYQKGSHTVCSMHFGSAEKMAEFCKEHKVMRLAVCDDRWRIKQISDDIDLIYSNGKEVLDSGRFYAGTCIFEKTGTTSGKGGNIGTAVSAVFIYFLEIVAWSANFLLLIVMIVISKKRHLPDPFGVTVLFSLFSLIDLILVVLYLMGFGLIGIVMFIPVNFPWILDLLLLLRYHSRYKKENIPQEYVPDNYPAYMETDLNYIWSNLEHSDRNRQ